MTEEQPILFVDKRRIKSVDDTCDDAAEADLERLPTFVEKLEKQKSDNEAQLHEYIAAHKEKMAEVDKVRVRLENDVENRAQTRFADMVRELLPLLDDLDRAIASAGEGDADDSLLSGVTLLRQGFMKILTKQGLTVIECDGKPFDPEQAQAVGVEPVEDEALDNVVIEVLMPGYQMGDRVLRPAMVRVGRKG